MYKNKQIWCVTFSKNLYAKKSIAEGGVYYPAR